MKDHIVFYHTESCPQCKMVERMLKQKNIEYEENMNIDQMQVLGISHVPVLEVNNNLLTGKAIINYLSK